MKNLLKAFTTMDKKQKMIIKGALIFFALCIVIVIVLGIIKNRTRSYSEMEDILVNSAQNYYRENTELLPKQDGGTVSVDSMTLIENKKMKSFEKYNKSEGSTCSGTVTVTNNNGYYLYIPNLKCENFKTNTLNDQILKDNEIVTEGIGLYEMNGDYVFRGEYPNNYVRFAKQTWRILRITSSGEIRLVQNETTENEAPWDNRYNVNSQATTGITKFELSRIKDTLNKFYENLKDDFKPYIINKQLCIGSRDERETKHDGSVECTTLTEGVYPISLPQVNEYVIASLDQNCKTQRNNACGNYNYLTKILKNVWSITPNKANDYEVYYINSTVRPTEASEYMEYKAVINLDGSIVYKSGNGTKDDPYIITE